MIDLQKFGNIKQTFFDSIKLREGILWTYKHLGLTANHLTIISQIFHIYSVIFLFEHQYLFILSYSFHVILDGIDGYYAQVTNSTSKVGNILDHGGDFLGSMALLIRTLIFFPNLLSIAAIGIYILTWIVIQIKKYNKKAFPSANFPYLYFFGFYTLGLWVHIFSNVVMILWIVFSKPPSIPPKEGSSEQSKISPSF